VPNFATDLKDLDSSQQCYIRSILLRAALGGMSGDQQFLRQFAAFWMHRFIHENNKRRNNGNETKTAAESLIPLVALECPVAGQSWLDYIRDQYQRARTPASATVTTKSVTPTTLSVPASSSPSSSSSTTYGEWTMDEVHRHHQGGGGDSRCWSWLWLTRLNACSSPGVARIEDLVLSGVDFHCSEMMSMALAKETPLGTFVRGAVTKHFPNAIATNDDNGEVAMTVMKEMIWHTRSSLTDKLPVIPQIGLVPPADIVYLQALHHDIRNEGDECCRRFIAQRVR
jgi:hypothetical protein